MNSIALKDLFVQSLLRRTDGPFIATVQKRGADYCDVDGNRITDFADYLSSEKSMYREFTDVMRDHVEQGGVLAIVKSGGHVSRANSRAQLVAYTSGKPVMFAHNDEIITYMPHNPKPSILQVPGFWAK